MQEPNCSIALTFYEIPTPRFSYFATSCDSGWRVQQNGSIHPPSRTKIIRLSVDGYPNSVVFAGFQLAPDLANFPPQSQPWYIAPGLNVSTEPTFPPTSDPTVLTLDFTNQTATRLFYRLAVRTNDPGGLLHWDDPKIYNDVDE